MVGANSVFINNDDEPKSGQRGRSEIGLDWGELLEALYLAIERHSKGFTQAIFVPPYHLRDTEELKHYGEVTRVIRESRTVVELRKAMMNFVLRRQTEGRAIHLLDLDPQNDKSLKGDSKCRCKSVAFVCGLISKRRSSVF
jgi:hypothetical protein